MRRILARLRVRRVPVSSASLDQVASTVHRLAVLLAAGVTPAASWSYLGDALGNAVTRARENGLGIPDAIRRELAGDLAVDDPVARAWSAVATAWDVASQAGAPLASTLRQHAAALRSTAAVERDIGTALAGPISTARIVLALPALGVVFGAALGFDSLRVLFTTPAGITCLIVGLTLVGVALGWIRSLVRAARSGEPNPGLRCDLMAIAVSGGASLDRATATVERALVASGLPATTGRAQAEEVLALSRRAGVPAAELLRGEAEEARRAAASDAGRRASVLGVRLMLPLGACILPAFMVLGVVPLLIAVISSTVVGF